MEENKTEGKEQEMEMLFGIPKPVILAMVGEALKNKDDIVELVSIVNPVVDDVIEIATNTIVPKLATMALSMTKATADNRKAMLDYYDKLGFSRDEAMAFIMADIAKTSSGSLAPVLASALSKVEVKK